MRKMFSKKQLEELIAIVVENSPAEVVKALKGQDINVEGITSKGIANTGAFGNIGDVAISGDLSATGDVKVFENIVDKDGHKRFIEGDITTTVSAATLIYGKWSLSGSHLLIVFSISAPSGTEIGGKIAEINDIPQWILDKITPIYSNVVDTKTITYRNSGGTSTQQTNGYLRQISSTKNLFITQDSTNLNDDRILRVTFDLLIDNEEQE